MSDSDNSDRRTRYLETNRKELRVFVPEDTDVRLIQSDIFEEEEKTVTKAFRENWGVLTLVLGYLGLGIGWLIVVRGYGPFFGAVAGAMLGSIILRIAEEELYI